MNKINILEEIENRKEELFELLSSMIKINSESYRTTGNEKALAEYIHKLNTELGLESEIYSPLEIDGFVDHPDYMPGRGLENRMNVNAVWKGTENVNELMLMAHTDTVEIGDIANWNSDPLSGELKDGKIFGRGACDDKYALATILFVIKLLKEAEFKPKSNMVFAAYSDEEYGGSHGALAAVLKNPCKRIVSMDGIDGQIWHCGAGGGEMKYTYHTSETVDSAKNAARAIPVVLDVLDKFIESRTRELSENRFYADTIVPSTSLRYMGVKAGDEGADLGVGTIHFVFYTDKTKEEIYAEFAEIEKELAEKLAPLGIIGDGFAPATRFFHYVFCEPDSEDIKLMVESSKEATGRELIVCGSCLSDLSVILKYGSNRAFGFGAGIDFSQPGGAHQPNEYIECDKLLEYAKTIGTYIIKVLG